MAAGCCGERAFGVTWGGRGGGGAVCWCLFGSKGGLQHRVFVGELHPRGALPFRSCAFSAPAFQPAPYARGLSGRGRGERRGTKGVRWGGEEGPSLHAGSELLGYIQHRGYHDGCAQDAAGGVGEGLWGTGEERGSGAAGPPPAGPGSPGSRPRPWDVPLRPLGPR